MKSALNSRSAACGFGDLGDPRQRGDRLAQVAVIAAQPGGLVQQHLIRRRGQHQAQEVVEIRAQAVFLGNPGVSVSGILRLASRMSSHPSNAKRMRRGARRLSSVVRPVALVRLLACHQQISVGASGASAPSRHPRRMSSTASGSAVSISAASAGFRVGQFGLPCHFLDMRQHALADLIGGLQVFDHDGGSR